MAGRLSIVGIGPGGALDRTLRAQQALDEAEVIVGFREYLRLAEPFAPAQEQVSFELGQEIDRAREAVRRAREGRRVALISSGDAGIYGMAGPCFEWLAAQGWRPGHDLEVEVIPGVSACQSAAALLGAPLMQDFVCLSLSDHLVPWDLIEARVRAVAGADMVICLYNPRSSLRDWQLPRVKTILLECRSPSTPVGIVREAARPECSVTCVDLASLDVETVDMKTVIIIGNCSTFQLESLLITPRGYRVAE